ncbi:DEAD/DEAH box helicase [Pseudorhizobium flavum]|uniref:DEAD/DEAH box helicase n=1 Tax=Pseudorhizobium flavum TaxID=1335061 RepID=UPI0037703843
MATVVPIRRDPPVPATPSAPPTSDVDLGPLPSFTRSGKKDDPEAILAAWTALEALSPQSYKRPEDLASGDRSRVTHFDRGIPWGPHAKGKPNYKIYFQVMLGAIALDKATDELVRVFGEDEERQRPDGRKAAIGAILVDKDGHVLEENGVAVSSFAWALKPALDLQLGGLGAWPSVERIILDKLDKVVRRHDEDGNPIPLDLITISAAHRWLVSQFNVPEHLVEAPTFALKVFHYYRAKHPPEPTLLNSFYLEDLTLAAKLVRDGGVGAGLRRYLGLEKVTDQVDVLTPPSAVEPFVAPELMPQARWPSDGGHPLVTLQQAAVNAARAEFKDAAGIMGVNGPPGTGKTTLLRDVVVGCVLDRASAMVRFDDPMDAFSTTGQKLAVGSGAFLHFYGVHASLRGHEIVVASSNNKAVENVSQELPLKKANGRHEEISYFRSISDLIANPARAGYDDGEEAAAAPVETWGLAAAVLGNGRNRAAFQQTFWWHEDGGFRTYIRAAKGDDVLREIKDERTGKVIRREMPKVVIEERPSVNETDAKAAWRKARNAFIKLKKEIDSELARLEQVRKKCRQLPVASGELRQLSAKRPALLEAVAAANARLTQALEAEEMAANKHRRDSDVLAGHSTSRPGFFSRLFNTKSWKSWSDRQEALSKQLEISRRALVAAEDASENAKASLIQMQSQVQQLERAVSEKQQLVMQLGAAIEQARSELGDRLIGAEFFSSSHEQIQLTAPWLPDSLHRKREDLFAAALAVQKAFVDASAQRVYHNISLVMTAFTAGALQLPAHRALLPDLWATMFMVVPAVSTTFASVRTMFGDLPPESIGWLLIDEAGQALPQAAVGSIMRAKRSIVVGDPLQIPPVVSLPERLTSEICQFFDIDQTTWAAPEASSQTLADRASRFKSTFRADEGDREVGLPLLVHRRCQDPMFSVSNSIAYAGQMVHAVGPREPGPIGNVLGPSRWVDVDGHAETKWCPEEGEAVLRMLGQLADARVANPDIFVITPFKIVEQEMRRRIEREPELVRALGSRPNEWVRDRVGTIHTFQGREANTVILLLGAPKAGQHRARQWAASPPNIINVAVSRAKQNLYVVGSKPAWSGAGTSLKALIAYLE